MTNPNKVGLVFGALLGGWHFLWVLLVATGWAQPLLNFVFWAHMIQPIYLVKAFDPVAAVTLLVFTSAGGYVFGYVGGLLWKNLGGGGR